MGGNLHLDLVGPEGASHIAANWSPLAPPMRSRLVMTLPLATAPTQQIGGGPGGPYFRHVSRFETASEKYAFLNRLLAVGAGKIDAGGPVHVIEELT